MALLVVVGATSNCARDSDGAIDGPDATMTEEQPGLFRSAAVSADSATAIAKRRVPGRITKAALEREGGVLLYSFDIRVPGQRGITEVHVDARTGAILAVERER